MLVVPQRKESWTTELKARPRLTLLTDVVCQADLSSNLNTTKINILMYIQSERQKKNPQKKETNSQVKPYKHKTKYKNKTIEIYYCRKTVFNV